MTLKAASVKNELESAMKGVPEVQALLAKNEVDQASDAVELIRQHTNAAKASAEDPVWALASVVPFIGPNLTAVTEVARSADDVSNLALAPLVNVFATLDWNTLLPNEEGADMAPLQAAAPKVSSAATAVRLSSERLEAIDAQRLLPQVSEPLNQARGQLRSVISTLDVAAHASSVLPQMLGVDAPRSYLLMIQNNAEARASGGIPGALAILDFRDGKLSLGSQSSAGDVGTMNPVLPVDAEQQKIYSGRLGKYMQDVNLTPDFPTAASTAQSMWERKTGQHVDGVISIDPVVLSYILQATGPVNISGPGMTLAANAGLPTELSGSNVVQTMLSDVYAKIEQPKLQDAYFAGVAQEVFGALSKGKGDGKGLIAGITKGVEDGRVLVWSGNTAEQSVIARYPLGGAVTGPSISPNEFGVYFNDGTGAKMDFYVKRTVQLVQACPKDGYSEVTVRVTSTNTAPKDAGRLLPAYVTAGGAYGVPPGSVQTNIVAYGPVQAHVESARADGQRTEFAPYLHGNRPVGVLAQRLAPGETKTVEFTFGKIVQSTEPDLVVTPTVQRVKDVVLPNQNASCEQG
ncbi:DUF4012 domain-containing protein [Pseudarthrobacter sp. BRE9]|uniref:DUF4012 domain-containing protein n=1 Tax=Pseudarthrobacter sp. BRE9 TaxID=2962582 RepID=UPI002880F444|nr:DUF4012 domain-containing protein [Pseudarthrobacter sp. BRE9]MDT0168131.1 DUF4012 domain-containing protein [Pseudarthrobacter sp. BRE9]